MEYICQDICKLSKSEMVETSSSSTKRPLRSKARNRFLLKMFSIREMLKWKYNYFEVVAHEHPLYRQCLKKYRVFRNSFRFKQIWRLKMDELYNIETMNAHRMLLQLELKRLKQSSLTLPDPTRMLVNYDREVITMMQRVRDEYNFFKDFPKCYPNYKQEKKSFLIQQCEKEHENGFQELTIDFKACSKEATHWEHHVADLCETMKEGVQEIAFDFKEKFTTYWQHRVAVLCDMKIAQEKRKIRENWRNLLPTYYTIDDTNKCPEELQELLQSDNEDESNAIEM